ncbi:MAG: acyltransferase [bacterium]|nr:acyltransferase [bacterium]
MKEALIKRCFILYELILHAVVEPRLRALLLRLGGARIGKNVRVYSIRIINPVSGFRNLHIDDNAHVGTDCLLDLSGEIHIGKGATLAPRVIILTHADAGEFHHNPVCQAFPSKTEGVVIGAYSWIGAGSTLLAGSGTGEKCVIGAMSLVTKVLPGKSVHAGIPTRQIRCLEGI